MKQLQAYFLCLVWLCHPSILGATLSSFLSGGVFVGDSSPDIDSQPLIEWVAASGSNFSGTASPVVSYPSVLQNDIMIAIFATDTAHVLNILPSGWTSAGTVTHAAGTDGSLSACWKRASNSETVNETWTNFFISNEIGRVVVIVYRNCIDNGNPFDTTIIGPSDESFGTLTSITGTSTFTRAMAVSIAGGDISSNSIIWDTGIIPRIDSTTTPLGYNNTGTSIGAMVIGEKALPNTGVVTMSGNFGSGVSSHSKILLILKPIPAS